MGAGEGAVGVGAVAAAGALAAMCRARRQRAAVPRGNASEAARPSHSCTSPVVCTALMHCVAAHTSGSWRPGRSTGWSRCACTRRTAQRGSRPAPAGCPAAPRCARARSCRPARCGSSRACGVALSAAVWCSATPALYDTNSYNTATNLPWAMRFCAPLMTVALHSGACAAGGCGWRARLWLPAARAPGASSHHPPSLP